MHRRFLSRLSLPSISRALTLLVLVACVLSLVAPDVADAARRKSKAHHKGVVAGAGVNDPRYADLIMNPVTGEVYHQSNPDGRRYPASLTKMMTLYLLFEALEQHKVTMSTKLDISEYATTMPQTNLALTPGDTIPVEIAIKALVVRSANDVAVVVGEALGGDVDHFGEMMTAKAHQLGMKNTVFQNPNGLPNSEQYTTARDMAKLGIALKRDFPKYYPYFATRQFSWGGASYYTHNRVMLRYAGTDGIKTGFIGASGFNLVTSVVRGGRPLVGVVMGGASGAWRDNRMIQLLDQTYGTIASRGAVRGKNYPENLPLSKNGKGGSGITAETAAAVEASAANVDTGSDDAAADQAMDDDAATGEADEGKAKKPADTKKPAEAAETKKPDYKSAVSVATQSSAPNKLQIVTAPKEKPEAAATADDAKPVPSDSITPKPAPVISGWGIQVGAFSSNDLATNAATQASSIAKAPLAGATVAIAGPAAGGSTAVYRARLVNISEKQAKSACDLLIAANTPCFIFKAGN